MDSVQPTNRTHIKNSISTRDSSPKNRPWRPRGEAEVEFYHFFNTHTHTHKNYIYGHIYQDFIIKTHYTVFCQLMIHDFS